MKHAPATMPRIRIFKDSIRPYNPDIINEFVRYASPCQLGETKEYWVLIPIIKGESNRPINVKGGERKRQYDLWLERNTERIKSFGVKCDTIY